MKQLIKLSVAAIAAISFCAVPSISRAATHHKYPASVQHATAAMMNIKHPTAKKIAALLKQATAQNPKYAGVLTSAALRVLRNDRLFNCPNVKLIVRAAVEGAPNQVSAISRAATKESPQCAAEIADVAGNAASTSGRYVTNDGKGYVPEGKGYVAPVVPETNTESEYYDSGYYGGGVGFLPATFLSGGQSVSGECVTPFQNK